jgi:two-component system sensor histidine kinase AlgZ
VAYTSVIAIQAAYPSARPLVAPRRPLVGRRPSSRAHRYDPRVATTHIGVPLDVGDELLPRELVWLYLVAPFAAAPVLASEAFSGTFRDGAVSILAISIPFYSLSLAFHLFYRFVMPHVVLRIGPGWRQWAAHVAAVLVVAPSVALMVRPLEQIFCRREMPLVPSLLTSTIISSLFIFTSLSIQRHRRRATHSERLVLRERQAALEVQLQALQARTNPHFLFNSLNTVASLIPDDPELAERTLERLADLFRYALDATKTRAVPLHREIEVVRDYLAVQQARFGDRLRTTVELDPRAAEVQVPPLLLQPLVENAILHGMANRKTGTVLVAARLDGDQVIIEVRDDGPGPGASSHEGTRTSLRDIGERLRLFYGGVASLALERAPEGGCLARVAVPA